MAAQTKPGTSPEAAGGHDLADMVTTLTRVLARLAVQSSHANGAATFVQIMVNELRIATDAEAQRLAAWLETHP